ncbi:MAG: ribulose-phosphate 3-epimerase [Endomicrobium sp.]|jgi:ribulose-phosphate 3-epimerase|nr:ribulose-phosphate 3-epimerase [Endomicrobium sp.]
MMRKIIVAPSILAANFATLGCDIKKMENIGADWIHIDIMDGHFVPNITIGPIVVKALRKITSLLFDVHLMITNPCEYWLEFQKAGANLITFHYEIKADKKKLIKNIKSTGIRVGISIKPLTPTSEIKKLIPYVDLILVMAVEPGLGGQSFMRSTISKINDLRKFINMNNYKCYISVDGGINKKTAKMCINAGINVLVSGSYIFNAKDPKSAIRTLLL